MAFFPSYRVMEEVYEFFLETGDAVDSVIQSQSMREEEREEFLAMFEAKRERSLVGFCVMGGIFSEGIDLAEDRLIGAVIVGTGLPQVCNDREIVRQYFEKREGRVRMLAFICAAADPAAKAALERLADLRDCEMHLSHMLTPGDEAGLRRLGIRATNDPLFATAELFVDA